MAWSPISRARALRRSCSSALTEEMERRSATVFFWWGLSGVSTSSRLDRDRAFGTGGPGAAAEADLDLGAMDVAGDGAR